MQPESLIFSTISSDLTNDETLILKRKASGSLEGRKAKRLRLDHPLLEEVQKHPDSSIAYFNLGISLYKNKKIELVSGTSITCQECFKRAIDLDPAFAQAYWLLSSIVPSKVKTTLLDGTPTSSRELRLKAYQLDPSLQSKAIQAIFIASTVET